MITELRIRNLGVIADASLDLHPGLTVVTGETGAGKTMIVTGIGLLLGGRADARSVRSGANRLRVEGAFSRLPQAVAARAADLGAEVDGDALLVVREVRAEGRSQAWLGGAQVPVGTSAELVADLVAIYGQSEQVALGGAERQREILDAYAGPELSDRLARYRERYVERRDVLAELERLRTGAAERLREIDRLRFGLDEIGRVAPRAGEEDELAAEAERLQSVDDLRAAASTAVVALAGDESESAGALDGLTAARRALAGAGSHDPVVAKLAERAAEVAYLVQDLTGDLASYLDGLDADPLRLEQIAERRAALTALLRRYGGSSANVLAWAEEAGRGLSTLEGGDERIEALTARETALVSELEELAAELTNLRQAAAATIAERVGDELRALAVPHARLRFDLTRTAALGPSGRDVVDLVFSASPGSAPRSLARVASGGELSRIRLALEVVVAERTQESTLVFDEVDAGVGGAVATEIGRRLATLARSAQVVVVTHLPQVAAFADRHFVVAKASDGQVTTSGVTEVRASRQAEELARMMAGLEESAAARKHARELLAVAAEHRSSTHETGAGTPARPYDKLRAQRPSADAP